MVALIMMRVKVASRWIKLLVVFGVVQSVLRVRHVSLHSRWSMDYRIFRRAGMDVLARPRSLRALAVHDSPFPQPAHHIARSSGRWRYCRSNLVR